MSRYINIAFGDSAAGTLKYYFSRNKSKFKGETVAFIDDLSVGPLYRIDTDEGLESRLEWVEDFHQRLNIFEAEIDIKKELLDLYQRIGEIEKEMKIVIWYGDNAFDLSGLSMLVSKLKDHEIYLMKLSENGLEDGKNNSYCPRSLGEFAPQDIGRLNTDIGAIDEEKADLLKTWEKLRDSKDRLRVFKDGMLIGVDEGYYDDEILGHLSKEFKKATRIVGETLGSTDQFVSDSYIDYRVRELITGGKIDFRGELKTMRDYEVKAKR